MNIVNFLPDDLLYIVWSHIHPINKIFLSKTNYIKYNYLIDKLISNYESYLRDIIRHDYNYVFNYILQRNFNKWIQINNFHYNNTVFPYYINYIYNFSKNNQSYKCMDLINFNLNISKLKKLNCKDTRDKKNKWII